ncbi:MAG: hypothetical protein OEW59_04835 [Gammaproteobacteria bacterium]|nr:hypothetical protein [Gammaproteobacteria bacterium]
MNLLSLILIAMALIVGACVFYVAWELSSGKFDTHRHLPSGEEGPGESKASNDPPGP